MTAIDEAHKFVYDQRTEVNSQAKVQANHATALEAALPPPAPEGTDWEAEVRRLRSEVASIDTEESTALVQIRQRFEAEKDLANQTYQAEINELERLRAVKAEAANEDKIRSTETARSAANAAAAELKSRLAPQHAQASRSLGEAETQAKAQQQATGTRLAAEKARTEAAALKTRSDAMTAALDRLKALKETVAARIPLKGIAFPDGMLADAKGVPFARWNDATKMTFCLKLAVLVHGEAGFICLVGAQQFDPEHRKALYAAAQRYAKEKGLQFVIATVTQGPLQITQPRPESKCTWCAEGMPVADGQHQTGAGPIPCLEKG